MENNDTTLPPMQIGNNAEESDRLVEEIKNTGVIESQDAAAATPSPDKDVTDGTAPPSIPTPVITRG